MITIFLNGVPFEVKEGQTLSQLLQNKGFGPEKIAVEVDEIVISKSTHQTFLLKSGMKIEIITFVGGG